MKFIKKKLSFVSVYILCLVIAGVLPELLQNLFVHPSGNIKILGLPVALLLSWGITARWRIIRVLFYIVFIPVLVFDIFLIFSVNEIYIFNYIVLLVIHFALLLVFLSPRFDEYLKTAKN